MDYKNWNYLESNRKLRATTQVKSTISVNKLIYILLDWISDLCVNHHQSLSSTSWANHKTQIQNANAKTWPLEKAQSLMAKP